ncbi:MAG: type II secretion system F family protein [Candidatus Omnitrophica bacterium]|nr:type II secretion system F family protein [Candidatus Omnitrophota bacterium]
MPYFIYKVRDAQGHEREGEQEAASEEALITQLQNEGLLIISVAQREKVEKSVSMRRRLHFRVTIDDLIIFTRQLATMLEAGVTLLESLDVLSKQIESRPLLETVEQVKHDVSAGSTFRDALARHPKIFSDFWVNVVETGEASGTLPASLTQLADYLESASSLRQKIVSALIYPVILIVMAFAALIVFTVWIVPVFSRVFDNFDVALPVLTNMVIAFSSFARRYILVFCAGLAGLAIFLRKYVQTEKGKWQFDQLKFKLPIISSLFQRIAIERFASGLGTLIESGVPILYGLSIIGKSVGNKVVEKEIEEIRESVRQGKGMSKPLEKSGVFTPMVVQLVTVGEEIGELGKMLKRIAQFYRERIATTLTRMTTMIEPAVLIFMGVVIGILVIALFMPIFQLAMVAGR